MTENTPVVQIFVKDAENKCLKRGWIPSHLQPSLTSSLQASFWNPFCQIARICSLLLNPSSSNHRKKNKNKSLPHSKEKINIDPRWDEMTPEFLKIPRIYSSGVLVLRSWMLISWYAVTSLLPSSAGDQWGEVSRVAGERVEVEWFPFGAPRMLIATRKHYIINN